MLRRRRSSGDLRSPRDWRNLAGAALLLDVSIVVAIVFRLVFLGIMFTVFLLPMAFLAGFLYRADLQSRGKRAPFRFMWVIGDDNGEHRNGR
jgi:hypothetical protein